MNTGVAKLLQLQGVVAAAEFSSDGTVLEFEGELELLPPVQALTIRLASKVSATFEELATTYSSISNMRWTPRRCWTYSGGDWTVVVGRDRLVFAHADEADLDALCDALTREDVEGR